MFARLSLAPIATAMLAVLPLPTDEKSLAPEYRLRIAGVLFRQGINGGTDQATSRQSLHIAAAEYQELVNQGFLHADLYLNLGNAHLLAGELPQAILAYRQGLRQHPLHGQLSENLAAARDIVAYPDAAARHRPPDDSWPPWLPRPALDALLHTALALYGLAWLVTGCWLIWRRRAIAIVALLLVLAAAGTTGCWAFLDYRVAQDEQHPLVVVAVNGVTLRRGNGSLYPPHPKLSVVNRGMEARLLGERGDWLQVRFPGGETGWLPDGSVLSDRARVEERNSFRSAKRTG